MSCIIKIRLERSYDIVETVVVFNQARQRVLDLDQANEEPRHLLYASWRLMINELDVAGNEIKQEN